MLRRAALLALLIGCRNVPALIDAGGGGDDTDDAGGLAGPGGDAGKADAPANSDDGDGPIMRRSCTENLGDALDQSFGRLDGYLVAIVPPQSSARGCNSDLSHIHLQILMQNKVYDIAVNVGSDVHTTTLDHAPFSAWAEGWHTGTDVFVEYTGLGLHSDTIPLSTPADMLAAITADLGNTNRITIYATGYGPDGAHLVHRNGARNDGMIVSKPLSPMAHMRVFSFDSSTPF